VHGQVQGIARIAAAQAALDRIALGLLDGHARHCMQGKGEAPGDPELQVDELMGAVGRLVRR
jgi:DNA-binding FrmR family transcriptional regulator